MSDLVQVNISMEQEIAALLDKMARATGIINRSAFIRSLIMQEYARRYYQPNLAIVADEALKIISHISEISETADN
jgi:metal-responsive CopG/Arc/MetJ family transcriptional regulator